MTKNKIEIGDLWSQICGILKVKYQPANFNTSFAQMVPIEVSDSTLTLGVEDDLFLDFLPINYDTHIIDAAKFVTDQDFQLKFLTSPEYVVDIEECVKEEMKITRPPQVVTKKKVKKISIANKCKPQYTFENFIEGMDNKFAYNAALTDAKSPGTYNPLFIYGGTGLGKTHLLQSVAHEYLLHHEDSTVEYITCEELMNQFSDSLRTKKHFEFRNKFRNVDILLVDDIQFLSKTKQLQEEFFNLFNTLYNDNKQIILSSDKPPEEINGIEDRLVSRFAFGLTAEILKPSFELRLAILKKKQETQEIKLSDKVLRFLATRITTSVRHLEGALIKLVVYANIMDTIDIDLEIAEKELARLLNEEAASQVVSIETIQKKVAERYDIRVSDILGKQRPQNIAHPRAIAMYLSREMTDLSFPEIAESFGGKTHATILHAHKKIKVDITKNEDTRRRVDLLISQIRS